MKRAITLFLTFCLLLSLLGAVPAMAEAEKADWWKPYDEPITITIVNEENSGALFPEGDDVFSNVWTRAFKERFNIDVVTEWVSDEYETKMNLAIASKSLPDMFMVKTAQFQQLRDMGYPADLTQVYEEYASDTVKQFMEAESLVFETAKADGKLYGMPLLHYGYVDDPNYLWIRKDWMEESGLTPPKTIEEMDAALALFKEKYSPDFALAIDQTLDQIMYLTPGFGAYYDIWIKGADGQIQYGSIQPEMKEALAKFAEWYEKGYIKKDFATMDYNAMMEDVINGKVGMQPFAQWWGYACGTDIINKNGMNAYFQPYEVPSVDGKSVSYPVKFPNDWYAVVNPNCEHPEVLIKLINFYDYVITQAVVKGEMTLDEMMAYSDGNRAHLPGPFRVQNPIAELAQHIEVQQAIKEGLNPDASFFSSATAFEKFKGVAAFIRDGDASGINIGHVLQLGGEQCAYKLGKQIIDEDRLVMSELWGASPEVLTNYGSTLKDLLKEGFTKIIMGVEPVDSFDALVESWKAAGGDEATAAVNEMYNK